MEAIFGSVKKAVSSVSKAAKKVVNNIGKAATSAAKSIKSAVIKGAGNLKAGLSSMVKAVMPVIKAGVINLIKGVTNTVGFFYRLWGDNIDMIDEKLLLMMPGGFIIRGLNMFGATDIHPIKDIPKLLARLFYKAVDALPGDSEQNLYKTVLFGFQYDYEQDITYTIPEAPQRMAGYTPTYDLASKAIGFDIAAQIITFTYGGKEYMIEVWKGDYWGAAGSEVGIYVREPSDDFEDEYFYNCGINDQLHMKTTLVNDTNKEVLFTRDDTHWWLTGFKPCEYLKPNELTLHVEIEFKNQNMAKKFMKEIETNSTARKAEREGNVVSWIWPGPKTVSIAETISEHTGGDITYDEMLDNTLNQFLNGDLILSQEELNKYYESK